MTSALRAEAVGQLLSSGRERGAQSRCPSLAVKTPCLQQQQLRLRLRRLQPQPRLVSTSPRPRTKVKALMKKLSSVESVSVQFVLVRECCFGQSFFVVGSSPTLGEWDLGRAVPMQWSEGHVWTGSATMSPDELVAAEFKFVKMGKRGELQWQPSANHSLADGTGPDIASPTQENLIFIQRSWEGEEVPPLPESLVGPWATEAPPEPEPAAEVVAVEDTVQAEAAAETMDSGSESEGEWAVGRRIAGDGSDTEEEGAPPAPAEPVTAAAPAVPDAAPPNEAVNGAATGPAVGQPEKSSNGAARVGRRSKQASPFVKTINKDVEWAESVLARLLGSWGRKPLMAEEEERK